jgi:hypothetical protein
MMPHRVQLSRAKGWKMPPDTIRVDRATKFGNPFRVTTERNAQEAVNEYMNWLTVPRYDCEMKERKQRILMSLPELRGKNLACWCKPGAPCHADVLLNIVERLIQKENK